MMKLNIIIKKNNNESGAIAVMTAFFIIFVLIGVAALAIDIGKLTTTRNELQNIADAVALAGTAELGRQHLEKMNPIDEFEIHDVAMQIAASNFISGKPLGMFGENWEQYIEILIGYWDEKHGFTLEKVSNIVGQKNSVKARLNLKEAAHGQLKFVFSNYTKDIRADATAALTGAINIGEGVATPVGISAYWYNHTWPGNFCDQPIKFYPANDPEACAGWNTFDLNPASANQLRGIFEGMLDGTYTSPELNLGDGLEFIGGNIANAFCHNNHPDLEDLWEANRDEDGNWFTIVAVYDWHDCSNPNTLIPIIGFSGAIIHSVDCNNHEIVATVLCNEHHYSRGGGANYGLLGSIPNLVE
ncbi:Putative Flp pilus-assembly TadE/G-like [Desulfonatronum thiosulfatophilum]|uniref:Putative Flp pilus-assembly TadE/G-like n=1 Tax=Desulfonatronum thiosulfatophilum TaxID=617002 RepID=A0A1G6C804_9BACT|nr:Tad domain-containing protein [Desulfonatronum thiosulfatophilum]SDB29026.1 Putative Flp pilus-assembly TadE/G-like [Desulfonatronum thiosulfatophilum]